jgi:hypothetical protein
MLVVRILADEKLGGVAPSTVRLAVTETLVQEIAKSAPGVHSPLKILKHFRILMFFNSVRAANLGCRGAGRVRGKANQEVTLNPRSTTLRARIKPTVNQPRKLVTIPLVNVPIN